ncbi:MAG: type II toxin-antitoxin system VapC family toxin [Parasulfuritortus sp.]|nr:type II toxin-antitoxin system VapC family toxin [Parasulfuritortus sp.]
MSSYVLDASAVLALLNEEPGAEKVQALIDRGDCAVSVINVTEVLSKLSDHGLSLEEARFALDTLELTERLLDGNLARSAAALRPATRDKGLSLADRCCLALTKSLDAVAVTADRSWLVLNLDIRVDCIRPVTE